MVWQILNKIIQIRLVSTIDEFNYNPGHIRYHLTTHGVNESNGGICIEPDNEHELIAAIDRMIKEPEAAIEWGNSLHKYVKDNFCRDALAEKYINVISKIVKKQ